MKITWHALSPLDFSQAAQWGVKDFLLEHQDFSLRGGVDTAACLKIAEKIKSNGGRIVFLWDLLLSENDLHKKLQDFLTLPLELRQVVRVKDWGVLEALLQKAPDSKIQLDLSSAHHNLQAIQRWPSYLKNKLDRLVLSSELPQEKIKNYAAALPVDLEVLALGRLLLFYTPRHLLSPAIDRRQAFISSEEGAHHHFPCEEYPHGTLLFHLKQLCLLSEWPMLKNTGVQYLRFDTRDLPPGGGAFVESFLKNQEQEISWNTLKEKLQVEITQGYFHKNKTDVLFKKLKNWRLLKQEKITRDGKTWRYCGEVVDSLREHSLTFFLQEEIPNQGHYLLLNAAGKEKKITFKKLTYLTSELLQVKWISGVGEKALLYVCEE